MRLNISLSTYAAAAAALLSRTAALSCSSDGYAAISSFVEPNQCIPGGFFQQDDLGNTNPTDMASRCKARCNGLGNQCFSYVGQLWKAADSNAYTGQCYYYSAAPPPALFCADHPTAIFAGQKDPVASCLASSTDLATAYCSSLLSISTVTVYTSTYTPVATTTKDKTTTTKTTTQTTSTTYTTSTSVKIVSKSSKTSTTVTSDLTVFTPVPTTITVTVTTTTSSSAGVQSQSVVKRNPAPSPAPACLPAANAPLASISSACACLSIPSPTVYLVSTASTTSTTSVTSVSVSTLVTIKSKTITIGTKTTTTSTTSSLTISTKTKVTTVTTQPSFTTQTVTTTSSVAPYVCSAQPATVGDVLTDNNSYGTAYRGVLDFNGCCAACNQTPGSFAFGLLGPGCYCFLVDGNTISNTQCPHGTIGFKFKYQQSNTFVAGASGPCGRFHT